MAPFTPGPLGVIRMPSWPPAMAFSIASIWPCSSPSSAPAAIVMSTLYSSAAALAPSCIATKNGLSSSW